MPSMMRIRLPFAGVFFLLLLAAGYAGLSSLQLEEYVNDKVLHVATFFALTVVFYWIIDTNRRRALNVTLVVCTAVLGVGSEFLQGFLPNGRTFDVYDIVANVVGSLAGVGLCSWYHKRMLDRKRQHKSYTAVPGDDADGDDVELGEGVGAQEDGVTSAAAAPTLEDELDNWDENAADDAWDDDGAGDVGGADKDAGEANGEHAEPKLRAE